MAIARMRESVDSCRHFCRFNLGPRKIVIPEPKRFLNFFFLPQNFSVLPRQFDDKTTDINFYASLVSLFPLRLERSKAPVGSESFSSRLSEKVLSRKLELITQY